MASAGKVLMLLENHYPEDVRVRNEAETLTSAGYQVTVIALRKKNEKYFDCINSVFVYRFPAINIFSKSCEENPGIFKRIYYRSTSIIGYVNEYAYFTCVSFFLSIFLLFRRGFHVIHAHNPPDTLFVIGFFYKLFGKKYVFDHHDLSPELYRSRMGTNEGLIHTILLFVEKMNLKLADVVIATNESYRDIEINRGGIDRRKIFIVRNGPNLSRIRLVEADPVLRNKGKHILGYLGIMGPQDGVDYLLHAIHYLKNDLKRNDFYCVVIGKGDSLGDLKKLQARLDLEDCVEFTGFIPDDEMIRKLSSCDICLDPNPSNPLNDVSTWIKVMEYMALGKPIISFELKETKFSAEDAAIYVPPNDVKLYAEAIEYLMDRPELRRSMGEIGISRVNTQLKWAIVSRNLEEAYSMLTGRSFA